MKRFEKILLSLLILLYLTNAYGSLVYSAASGFSFQRGIDQESVIKSKNPSNHKSHIFNRRHLPLTKKLEIGKHFPLLNEDFNCKRLYDEPFTLLLSADRNCDSLVRDFPCNKAPPYSS